MPRFFFNIDDGSAQTVDLEGTELSSLQCAKEAAIDVLGSAMRDHPARFMSGGEWYAEVLNADGVRTWAVSMRLHVGS